MSNEKIIHDYNEALDNIFIDSKKAIKILLILNKLFVDNQWDKFRYIILPNIYYNIALAYKNLNDFETTILYCDLAVKAAGMFHYASAYKLRAYVYAKKGDYKNAFQDIDMLGNYIDHKESQIFIKNKTPINEQTIEYLNDFNKGEDTFILFYNKKRYVCSVKEIINDPEIKKANSLVQQGYNWEEGGYKWEIGQLVKIEKNSNKALQCYLEAKEIMERINYANTDTYKNYLSSIARVYKNIGEYDKSLEYYLKIKDFIERLIQEKKQISLEEYINVFNNIGELYDKLCNYDKAIEYFDYLRNIITINNLKNKIIYPICLNNLGNVWKNKSDYTKALNYFKDACYTMEQEGLSGLHSSVYAKIINDIGNIYQAIGENDNALDYCKRSLEILEKSDKILSTEYADYLANIGQIYEKKGDNSNAIEYIEKSKKIRKDILSNEKKKLEEQAKNKQKELIEQSKSDPELKKRLKEIERKTKTKIYENDTLMIGLFLLFLGIALTIISIISSKESRKETFIIYTGLIVVGIINILRGLK